MWPAEASRDERSRLRGGEGQTAWRTQLAERELGGRQDHVAKDGRSDQPEEQPAERGVDAPERPVQGGACHAARAQDVGERPPDERPGLERRVRRRDARRLQQEAGHPDRAEQTEDHQGDSAALEPGDRRSHASPQHPADAGQECQAGPLEQEGEHQVRRADEERDHLVVDEDEAGADEEAEEAVEEERVRPAGARVLEEAPVEEDLGQDAPERRHDAEGRRRWDPAGRGRWCGRAG